MGGLGTTILTTSRGVMTGRKPSRPASAAKFFATSGKGELMSRIGRKPIAVPKGVTVTVKKDVIEFKGPKGAMKQGVPPGISFEMSGTDLVAKNIGDRPELEQVSTASRAASWPTRCRA
jgi:hypothetical protein